MSSFVKRVTLLALVATLCYGCDSDISDDIGAGFKTRCCIQTYIDEPVLTARFVKQQVSIWAPNVIEDDCIEIRIVNQEGAKYIVYNEREWKWKEGTFYILSQRYGDTSFNDYHVTGSQSLAVAEPFGVLKCFEVNPKSEEIEVTDRLYAATSSYLPFIESGYDKTLDGLHSFFVTRLKLASKLTEKDLTLLNWGPKPAIRLWAKSPYRLPKTLIVRTSYKGEKIELTVQRPEEK